MLELHKFAMQVLNIPFIHVHCIYIFNDDNIVTAHVSHSRFPLFDKVTYGIIRALRTIHRKISSISIF